MPESTAVAFSAVSVVLTGATEVAAAGVVAAAAVVAADCPTPSDLSAAIMAFASVFCCPPP